MQTKDFNIFNILAKDDKELIHSAVLGFLLEDYPILYKELFLMDPTNLEKPKLEVLHRTIYEGRRIRLRTDIEVSRKEEDKPILVIENKFKSFPQSNQLELYSSLFDHPKLVKVLLCFDTRLVKFKTDWVLLDYESLLYAIEKHCQGNNSDSSKEMLIDHYCSMLKAYYEEYKKSKNKLEDILTEASASVFFKRLYYSAIAIDVEYLFQQKSIPLKCYVGEGNTSKPFFNVMPESWHYKGKEIVIQIQENWIKLYLHANDKRLIEELLNGPLRELPEHFERKPVTTRESNTSFIVKTPLLDNKHDKDVNISTVTNRIFSFYDQMDKLIFKNEGV